MIIHADMDAFFASVEIREQPELRGKPVVVAGRPDQRGVVAAASYEARKYGVRSAMPTSNALKLCPELIILPGHMALYSQVSAQIHAIFSRYTPLIEPLSLDEAFLDVSTSVSLFGPTVDIARRIKQEVRDELALVISIGVAPNKFLAKIASDLEKPDGFVVLEAADVQHFLDPLPVSRLWGVGKVTEQRLHDLRIYTVAQLRQLPESQLKHHFGLLGEHLWRLAHGQDKRAVTPDHNAKSISHETTFAEDISDADILRGVLLNLTEQVTTRLRRKSIRGRKVQLKLRFDNFHTITRVRSLSTATDNTKTLWESVLRLFDTENAAGLPPIRLIGMGVGGFDTDSDTNQAPTQLSMFEEAQQETGKLDKLADDINHRFGQKMLSRARGIRRPE
ncbi:MAG: DNA polymerase IV [Ectothiorhodospiraceae bacterium]|nr:DNA polymerase IV [Ectothiorhodospiraceae bacterium]